MDSHPKLPPPPGLPKGWVATLAAFAVLVGLGIFGLTVKSGRQVSSQAQQPAKVADDAINRLREVDPKLVKWHEAMKLDLSLDRPRAIATNQETGDIYVVGDQALQVFTSAGKQRAMAALGQQVGAVAVAPAHKRIYLATPDRVLVHDTDLRPLGQWESLGPKARITCLAVQGDKLLCADAGNRVVWLFDKSGRRLGDLGRKDPAKRTPGLVIPSPHLDVVPLSGGLLLVNNPGRRELETYSASGELKTSWGTASPDIEGFCGCCNPTDIAPFPGKSDLIATAEKGLVRIKVYRRDGALDSVVATPKDFDVAAEARDLAVDKDSRILVLDPPTHTVRIYVRNAVQ